MVMGQHNLILCLHEAGRSAEAAALIPEARRLYEQVGALTYLPRLRWTEGRVLIALGRLAEAEAVLLEVRDRFIEETMAFDAALVSLDLSTLYLQQGRSEETRRLTAELIPVFQSHEIYHEALASLVLFQKAAEMEQLTAGLIEEIAAYLQEARGNPHLKFRDET